MAEYMTVDNGLFYEFVAPDQLSAAAPARHWLADVRIDVDYVAS